MSDPQDQGYPSAPEDAADFLNGLVFDDTAPTPELPPTSEQLEAGMVTTSLKLPPELRNRLRATAAEHCIPMGALIRQFCEMGLAAQQPDRMIPLSDAIRVLSSLRETA
ncbi:hypothetical protein [Nocardia jejuensis]|uniref:hypothetical protein n=1 Tax=Nocardia jejuensis TaxID=328049 RepID=UPI00082A7D1B|nr:hypothetical protein [Nocardia jejuensis]